MIDYHIHTKLCRHAKGEIIEYIEKANSLGIKELGFADHFPMNYQPKFSIDINNITMRENEIEDYFKILSNSKESFQNIKIGFEVDYYEKENNFFKKYSHLYERTDFIIGSVHFIDELSIDQEEFIEKRREYGMKKLWVDYFNEIIKMIKNYRNLIDIVGHLDLPKKFNDKLPKDLFDLVLEVLKFIKWNELVIEINTAGWHKKVSELYPSIDIIKMAKDYKIEFTIGSDAHSPEEVGREFKRLINILNELDIKKLIKFRNHRKDYYKI